MDTLELLTDQALLEDGATHEDGLGFETYAKVLARAARGATGPFTIGVFGEWGTGKTSLMKLVQHELDPAEKVLTVWFNAWRYEQEEHPIVPLVGTIVKAVEHRQSLSKDAADFWGALGAALRSVAYSFSLKVKAGTTASGVEAGFNGKDAIERYEALRRENLLERSLYHGVFEQLQDLEFPGGVRVVVFIDDLDRCLPNRALALLESIKLVLAQRGFVFVLGVARAVLEGYLQHRYQQDYGIAKFKGRAYLDKIVQLPFDIPPHGHRMDSLALRILARLPESTRPTLRPILSLIGRSLDSNPRSLIRFVNNVLVDLEVYEHLPQEKQQPSVPVPVEYFAISRCLQHRWHFEFGLLTARMESDDDLAGEVVSWTEKDRRDRMEDPDKYQDASHIALTLTKDTAFRKLLIDTEPGRNWLQKRELRVAAVRFLRTQGRTEGPAPAVEDRQVDLLLSFRDDDEEAVAKLVKLLRQGGMSVRAQLNADAAGNVAALSRELAQANVFGCCLGAQRLRATVDEDLDAIAAHAAEIGRGDMRVIPILLPGFTGPKPARSPIDLQKGITTQELAPLMRILTRSRVG